MDLSLHSSALLPLSQTKPSKPYQPNTDRLNPNPNFTSNGVPPTPKSPLRQRNSQRSLRRSNKQQSQSQSQSLAAKAVESPIELKGKPWEGSKAADLVGIGGNVDGFCGGKLKREYLDELREVLEERNGVGLKRGLDEDDDDDGDGGGGEGGEMGVQLRGNVSEDEKIQVLVERLSSTNLSIQDWKFPMIMKQSNILFSEMHLLRIIEELGFLGNWRLAMSVVEWVYNQKDYKHHKSRFVYTKLLAVLGKARRPIEACQIFSLMQKDGKLYPDMAAYHAIAVTLGQAGLVSELIGIVECMRQPPKRIKNFKRNNWDPCLEPDIIIYNAVLNACVPSHQWKGAPWVLKQMRLSGLRPTETTYGLAMEVMLKAGKYELVHKYFETMRRGGLATKALTYKVLVRAFWEEDKVDEAVEAARDMEQRGVVGAASVYYELACCLCNKGRWQDAIVEVEKLKRFPHSKPLEVTFTGMILSSLDGGHPSDCISILEYMKNHCTPNIGTINAMLKVYNQSDMFGKAKELFESIKDNYSNLSAYLDDGTMIKPDAYSYNSMLEASASSHQWEYFEYVYKEMALCGFKIDQSKHVRLLVAASQAGKWHLLEHAIDSILEAGEIPRAILFTEFLCHTISEQNFERAVALLNGMARASLRVSESQWMNIFNNNKDRFSKEKLENLLNHLDSSSNLVKDEPIPNFIGSVKLYGQIPSAPTENERERIESSIRSDTLNDGVNGINSENENKQLESSLEFFTADTSDCSFSELPSASDILEKWKEERIKDGAFLF